MVSNTPYMDFKLFGNIIVPNWVDPEQCPKRRDLEVDFMISKI